MCEEYKDKDCQLKLKNRLEQYEAKEISINEFIEFSVMDILITHDTKAILKKED